MKNQYVGDINDYRKYGLLRVLQSTGNGRLLVVWMLTPDDGGPDGNFRSYLRDSKRWAKYDQGLFDGLAGLADSGQQLSVSQIEGSSLLPRASYFSETVPDARGEREAWCGRLRSAAANIDLVFLDPDNGIEIPSKPVGRAGSSKYVLWTEIEQLWDGGASILVYQHFRREPRQAFAERMAAELRVRTGAHFVQAFRTPHVLFLLAAQDRHAERFEEAISVLSNCWGGQMGIIGLANRRP